MDDGWHRALDSATLAEGRAHHATIAGVDILFVRIGGAVHALSNLCTHADACLHEGRVRGHRILCPLHGASFDARTGAVLGKPATVPLRRYDAKEQDGAVWVLLAPAAA
jgi:nitrite reductase/ring-hydroxylating ferredoxin subunit